MGIVDVEITGSVFDRCHVYLTIGCREPCDHCEDVFWEGEVAQCEREDGLPQLEDIGLCLKEVYEIGGGRESAYDEVVVKVTYCVAEEVDSTRDICELKVGVK